MSLERFDYRLLPVAFKQFNVLSYACFGYGMVAHSYFLILWWFFLLIALMKLFNSSISHASSMSFGRDEIFEYFWCSLLI